MTVISVLGDSGRSDVADVGRRAGTDGGPPVVAIQKEENGLRLTGHESEVRIGPGETRLAEPLVIGGAMTIRGNGLERSTLILDGPGTIVTVVEDGALILEDLSLIRRSSAPGNVVTVESGSALLVRARLRGAVGGPGFSGSGLVVDGAATATLEESLVEDNDIGLRSLGATTIDVRESSISRNAGPGVVFSGRSTARIRDSVIEGNGEDGFVVGQSAFAEAVRTVVRDNTTRGVSLLDQASAILRECTVEHNGFGRAANDYWQGIGVEDDARADVLGTTVRANAGVGIQFLHRASGRVDDNDVTGNNANLVTYETSGLGEGPISVGGLALGLAGRDHVPRPLIGSNRFARNEGGGLVDYRPANPLAPPGFN